MPYGQGSHRQQSTGWSPPVAVRDPMSTHPLRTSIAADAAEVLPKGRHPAQAV